jgi:small subunit ribosomal protein S25e
VRRNKRRSGPRERVRSGRILQEGQTLIQQTVKDKAQHAVILDKATSDKLYKDVQSYRLITVATLVDRLKINGSLARRCLADLEEKGQIKKVVGHSKLNIYSMFSLVPKIPYRMKMEDVWK